MSDGKADGSAKPPRAPDESKAPGKNLRVVPTPLVARPICKRTLSPRNRESSPVSACEQFRGTEDALSNRGRTDLLAVRRKDREGHKKMMSRLAKTITVMVLTTPLIAASLGGCIWHTKETKEVERERGGDKK